MLERAQCFYLAFIIYWWGRCHEIPAEIKLVLRLGGGTGTIKEMRKKEGLLPSSGPAPERAARRESAQQGRNYHNMFFP